MDLAYQKVREALNDKIAAAKRAGAPRAEVEKMQDESERLSREHAVKVDAYLAKSRFVGQVGAFEGAGYASDRPVPADARLHHVHQGRQAVLQGLPAGVCCA